MFQTKKRKHKLSLDQALPTVFRFSPGLTFRSFVKPPKQVQMVCECILVLRGHKEISWQSCKAMMSEANFLRSLMEMDCDSISNSQVTTVKGKILS